MQKSSSINGPITYSADYKGIGHLIGLQTKHEVLIPNFTANANLSSPNIGA
jgi:hypothetical protein